MRLRRTRWAVILAAHLAALQSGSTGLEAGGPLLISKDGKPRKWGTSRPVTLNPDRGSLGRITSPLSVLQSAVSQWNEVATSSLRVEVGALLPNDVEGLTEAEFTALISKDDNTNPVIFDSTGAMFEAVYGDRSGVVGVAGPSLVRSSDGVIVKGFAMFNGEGASDLSVELTRAAMTHEIGHLLNLEHAQINGNRIGGTVPGFDDTVSVEDVETMFPILVQTNVKPHPMSTLQRDDIASLSALYPSSSFASTTAAITGTVLDVDGETPMQGLNVIARNVSDPFGDAYSYVSGLLYGPSPSTAPKSLQGAYELRGLTHNATYKIYIEEVSSAFRAGARVGPLDPPRDVDTSQTAAFIEFWNGSQESSDDPPDSPLEATPLRISAGGTASRTDFVFNGVNPRVAAIVPASGSYLELVQVSVTGANFVDSMTVTLQSPARSFQLVDVVVESSSLLRAKLPAGAVPAVYKVIAMNSRGSSEPGPAEFRVTEPLPVVTATLPDALENSRARTLSILGEHLLGSSAFRLVREGSSDIPLTFLSAASSTRAVCEVPAGIVPGSYSIVPTNTAGDGPASTHKLFIVEQAPVLSTETDPPSARNSGSKEVRILGSNLAGTTAVELVVGETVVPLVIRGTSLNEVIVTVPGGLEPATYTVRITNTEGTATGPAVFTVRSGGGGGGGGCSTSRTGSSPASWLLFAAFLVLCRGRRKRPT